MSDMAYEKTRAAIAKLDALRLRQKPVGARVRIHRKGDSAERHQYEYEMCEAYEAEAGVPFSLAWQMRKQIPLLVADI
jgi:hypothetical protein